MDELWEDHLWEFGSEVFHKDTNARQEPLPIRKEGGDRGIAGEPLGKPFKIRQFGHEYKIRNIRFR
jgi:hypothetical protein